ncbi:MULTISPECIES: ABC transporter ATP-binding protein [Vogesella]|jgi:putative ABC transport system ATP-binding protein|uniref:ABC transporter ATP-binding protein n=1 Tax=Vogesella TaxID=57739 RepID=UPI000EB57F0A|nr:MULTISPECIES: ATP-binding cassette domain-containing protein [Vogesella]MCQ4146042.1 ATP-binding cassette domain-containing protein [Vogesella sp. AC12]MDC7702037.1 ATP-binding cassette domain-containing protein [Vogesella indigofera]MDC7708261.1 ATP-binding cassette domain-containing protein [Vogesella indigofera]
MNPSPENNVILRAEALARQVDYHGQTLTILHQASFSVAAGESVAIVGASGSGKSTLLAILAGLDPASSGEVWLDGQALSALDEDQRALLRRDKVGFVFQNFQLMPQFTALENVMLPLELAGRGDARAAASAMLQRVGLGHRLDHYPRHLSGGEQQRVALARAFVVRPTLLFADEPTGNLDPATGRQVIELLFQLNAEAGTALVLVTHDTALASRCAAVYRLNDGRLQREAT